MAYVRVKKSNGVEFHWDPKLGLKSNIRVNLKGFEADQDDEQSFDGYLDGSHSKTEVAAAEELLIRMESYHSEAEYLQHVVEPLFHDLPSHRNGKPSQLYAIIQHAIQESTKKREAILAGIENEIIEKTATLARLPAEITKNQESLNRSKGVGVELGRQLDNLNQELPKLRNESAELSRESEELKSEINSIDQKTQSLLYKNTVLEQHLQKPLEGSSEERAKQSEKYRQSYSSVLSKASLRRAAEYEKLVDAQSKKTEMLKKEKARNKQLRACVVSVRESLSAISEKVGCNIPIVEASTSGNIGLLARFIRVLSKKDMKVSVSLEVKKDLAEVRDENLRPVNPNTDKSFGWNDSQGLSDNIERLMMEYLGSPGYHSPDRQESARGMLRKIADLRHDPKRDQKLMEHIRQQTIASHGLSRKRSKLHAIYREAELSYRSELIIESHAKRDELKVLNKAVSENEELNKKLASSVRESDGQNNSILSQIGDLKVEKEELRGKIKSDKKTILEQKSVIKDKRAQLFKLQQNNLVLDMRYHSSDKTPKSEAAFLKEQLAKLEILSDSANKIDEVKEKFTVTEREIAVLSSENTHLHANVQMAYHEVRVLSRDHKDLTMAPVADDASIDFMAAKVEVFANALKEKAPTVSAEVQTSSVDNMEQDQAPKMD